jgi:hypothetical protein
VIAALIGAGRCNRQVTVGGNDRRDRLRVVGVANADAPRRSVRNHVAARVDAETVETGGAEPVGRALHGPALDERRRVERTMRVCVEVATGLAPQPLAAVDHPAHVLARGALQQLAAVEAADGAVGPVGAEFGIDIVQPAYRGADRAGIRLFAAHVDGHHSAHHVFDVDVLGFAHAPTVEGELQGQSWKSWEFGKAAPLTELSGC